MIAKSSISSSSLISVILYKSMNIYTTTKKMKHLNCGTWLNFQYFSCNFYSFLAIHLSYGQLLVNQSFTIIFGEAFADIVGVSMNNVMAQSFLKHPSGCAKGCYSFPELDDREEPHHQVSLEIYS